MIKLPQQYYFNVNQVLPTKEDGVQVMAYRTETNRWEVVRREFLLNWSQWYSHWMQMPKAPSDQHEHAFLE